MTETTESQGFRWANAFRFSPREAAWTAVGILALLVAGPCVLWRVLPLRADTDYRVPYELSSDYWHVSLWLREASGSHGVLAVGDSLVWGEYVAPAETLSARLNLLAGPGVFANLGLNGLHPMAMHGLLRHHGRSVRQTNVLLVLNLLWLSSPEHDLRVGGGEDDADRLNHPELMPQFIGTVPGYRPSLERRLTALARRLLPFLHWAENLRALDEHYGARARAPERASLSGGRRPGGRGHEPQIHMPGFNPLRALTCAPPQPGAEPHGSPVDWKRRGIREAGIAWPDAGESVQLRGFLSTLDLLRSRGNRVFVLVSPFNPYILQRPSREAYHGLVAQVERRLADAAVPHFSCPAPASEQYADASHPLADGYERVARELYEHAGFREWLEGGAFRK